MDGVCAVCRTDEGVNHECQACGFEFCDTHAAPGDHDCPSIDTESGTDSSDAGGAGSGAGGASATRFRKVATRDSAAASKTSDVASTVRTESARRARTAARSLGSTASILRDRLSTAVSRVDAPVDGDRATPGEGRGDDGDERRTDTSLQRARRSVMALLERGRRGIERGIERGLDRAGREATGRQKRLASIGLVVLVLLATSAVLLGTSGIVTDGLSDGETTDAPTNELVADGNDTAALESPAAFDEALLAEVNAAREGEGVTRLETDDELAQVAADHSDDMAGAESASLDAWDRDRLADRLEGTDTPCETVAQTGGWIDAGGETDADALASNAVDRWLDDDAFREFLLSGDHDRGAIASAAGDDGRRYVSITMCGS